LAAGRRLRRPAVQLDELPAAVLDARIVHGLLQPVGCGEVAGDPSAAPIEGEQHVLADLILLRVAPVAERDPRARLVPREAAGIRPRPRVSVEVQDRASERAVLAELDARADAGAIGARQGAAVDARPIER